MLKKLKQLVPLTREGTIFLLANVGLLVTGLFKGINLISLLTCSMICLVGLNIFLAGRQLRGLRGKRLIYDPIFARTPFALKIEVHNASKRKRTGIALNDPGLDGGARWFVNEIKPGETVELERSVVISRRGMLVRGPLAAASGFPFGLALRRVVLAEKQPTMVLPYVGALHPGALRRLLSPTNPNRGDDFARPVRHAAAQSEIHGLREYRQGDSPRWIHWRTSARRDDLFVREYEDNPSEQLTLIVDPWLSADTAVRSADALLEDTITLAATLIWEWCRQTGNPFFVAIAGRSAEIIAGATSRDFALKILERLANESGYTHADHDGLLTRLANQRLARGRILAVCTRAGELVERLTEELHAQVICISLADETLDEYMSLAADR